MQIEQPKKELRVAGASETSRASPHIKDQHTTTRQHRPCFYCHQYDTVTAPPPLAYASKRVFCTVPPLSCRARGVVQIPESVTKEGTVSMEHHCQLHDGGGVSRISNPSVLTATVQ
jgi:hypothetical protein